MDERERSEALRRVSRQIAVMPPADQIGRGEWVQTADGQWVRADRAGYDVLDVDRQTRAGEESQVDPDGGGEHIA